MTRYVSLLGLGFGDCGKGLFTDFLCRRHGAHTVVRFNGGAQAGHNVVLPDGRHHTFSQFGAGTFQPGVATVLASPVVVHPTALAVEAEALRQVGVHDALDRLQIDARCRVTTPFHQAAGRLREWRQGHGSCGVGVGETVRQSLAAPELTLHYGDLGHADSALDKLEALRRRLLAEFDGRPMATEAATRELALLAEPRVAPRWLDAARAVVQRAPPAGRDAIARRLARPGTVVFEGAQGVLLDEWRGFHPHTTWSSVSSAAVEAVLAELGLDGTVRHLGVMRSYLTRHGAGPLPTADPALDGLAEPHNPQDGWQGRFRRGHPDAVLWRYALDAVGALDGLLVSHLDVFDRAPPLRWCRGYELADTAVLARLSLGAPRDLAHQQKLTRTLGEALPVYDQDAIETADALVARIEALSGLRVCCTSTGPVHEAVRVHAADWA
ncbi:MAG: adenylosuccinate synthetase [Variovorax sp.]